jgi:hypothetical protein
MPFKKMSKTKGKKQMYMGPSGRKFTKKQVALYYANDEKFPSQKEK